jgi:hypothetical protein
VREVRVHWNGGDAAQIQPKKVGTVKNTGKRERERETERAREGGREEQRSGDRR